MIESTTQIRKPDTAARALGIILAFVFVGLILGLTSIVVPLRRPDLSPPPLAVQTLQLSPILAPVPADRSHAAVDAVVAPDAVEPASASSVKPVATSEPGSNSNVSPTKLARETAIKIASPKEPIAVQTVDRNSSTKGPGAVEIKTRNAEPRAVALDAANQRAVAMVAPPVDDVGKTPSVAVSAKVEPRVVQEVRSGESRPPQAVREVKPVYPPFARSQKVTGTVVVEITVGVKGDVEDAKVLASPSPLLNDAALSAARQMKYEPALADGVPIRATDRRSFKFGLK